MFGYVTASMGELTQEQRQRYMGCYCGICRAIGRNSSGPSRLSLNYDMVFLALLLSSLYEPEEEQEASYFAASARIASFSNISIFAPPFRVKF